MKIRENSKLKKIIINTVIAAAVAGGFYLEGNAISQRWGGYYLSSRDFDQLEWCKIDNSDGRIWKEYTDTDIPKNQPNWQLYVKKVLEKNPGRDINNLDGWIYVPCRG